MMMASSVMMACALAGVWGADPTDVDALSLLQTRAQVLVKPEKASPATSSMVRLLDFTQAEIVFNNLGGSGPNKTLPSGEPAPKEIRYRNLVRGQAIDLVITAPDGYEPYNADRNGILGGNGQVNAKSGETVPLTFTFVDQGTYEPHSMPKFYMTFSDIDERHGGVEFEKIAVDSYSKYYTNDDLKLIDDNNPYPTFQSSDFGDYSDNDFSPDSPEPTQLSHAVTYLFLDKASFHAVFSVKESDGIEKNKGRNVLFSGISQLVFCQDPSTYLDFKNSTVSMSNLGGKGPMMGPDELRYSNIGMFNDEPIDLVVTADETYGYQPSNSSQNGLHGDFGHINLFCGPTEASSEAYLTFTMVKSGTSTPVVLNAFAFTVFDFDAGLHEQQVEYVDMGPNQPGFEGGSGYASYIVTSTTELAVLDGPNGKRRFKATKHGTEADNPKTSQMLAREVADKSVVFTFRQTSSFKMTLGITPTGFDSGRNFMFSGQDMYLMCD